MQKNVKLIDDHLSGSGRLDVLIKSTSPETFKTIDAFKDLRQRISQSLGYPLINGTNDITVPVQLIHHAFDNAKTAFPNSSEELEQELLFLEFSRGETKTDVLSSVVDFNYQNTRIEFMTNQLPSNKIKEVVHFLSTSFSEFKHGTVSITGSQFLSYILGKYVLKSQFITIIITLTFVWVLFISIFGIKLGSIGMFPNIIPMMITLSLLPMTNTAFDFATVLISSVTLGLCVDDTIRWLLFSVISKKQ